VQPGHAAEEEEEPQGDVEQVEADDDEAHDGAAAEGDLEAAVEALLGGVGGAGAGVGGGAHAEEAAEAGEESAGEECEGDPERLDVEAECEEAEDEEEDDEDDGDDAVLAAEIGVGAVADVAGDGAHRLVAFGGLHHRLEEDERKEERGDAAEECERPPSPGGGGLGGHLRGSRRRGEGHRSEQQHGDCDEGPAHRHLLWRVGRGFRHSRPDWEWGCPVARDVGREWRRDEQARR